MPKITPYHLDWRGSLHLGARGMGLESVRPGIPADTLFAALVSEWRLSGRTPDDFVEPFVPSAPDPPFLLSSAFPYAGQVRFFPAPVDLMMRFGAGVRQARRKEIKRIAWISEALLREALTGKALDGRLFPENDYDDPKDGQGVALQGGTLWLTTDEAAFLPAWMQKDKNKPRPLRALRHLKVYATERVPRVTVDRVSDASNIFHAGRTSFAKECGLWFGVQWLRPQAAVEDMTYEQALMMLMQMLADSGLGGERTYGYGAFSFAVGDAISLPDPKPASPAYLLSRYHPRPDDLPKALQGAYRLESVAGWLESPDGPGQRRKRLHLLAEGSLIAWPGAPAGDVVDVRPEYEDENTKKLIRFTHPVWRYGLALAAGQKEKNHA